MLLLPVPVPGSLLPRGCRDRGKTAIYNLLIKLRNKLITIHNIFILVFCLPLLFGLPPKMMDPQSHALPPGHGHTASPIHPTLLPPTPIEGWLLRSLIVCQQPKASSWFIFIYFLSHQSPPQTIYDDAPPTHPSPATPPLYALTCRQRWVLAGCCNSLLIDRSQRPRPRFLSSLRPKQGTRQWWARTRHRAPYMSSYGAVGPRSGIQIE